MGEHRYTFQRVLKTANNKAALEKVAFVKGTCMNYNKDLDDFVYFLLFLFSSI